MTTNELNQIVTKQDLESFGNKLLSNLNGFIQSKFKQSQEFFSPKEFSHLTGMPYATVVYKCTSGKLKAFQEAPNCTWHIDVSEIERFRKSANANVTGE